MISTRRKLLSIFIFFVLAATAACASMPLTILANPVSKGSVSGSPDLQISVTSTSQPLAVASDTPTAVPTSAVVPSITPTETVPALQPAVVKKEVQSAADTQAPASDLLAYQNSLEAVYKLVNPSVVSIQVVEQSNPYSSRRRSTTSIALGSGFVWDTQGHIVTNNHVISGATSIMVTFADNSTADAKVVGADPNSDLAVIQVNVPAAQLFPVQLADSTRVEVGQIAIAIGNPFGLQNTMTQGIISALSRTLPVGLDNSPYQTGPTYSIPDILQTDASINPGNSGGVLVDIQGQVLGVPSAIESSSQSNSGVGFVIPSEIVKRVVPALIQKGTYEHPWIGVDGANLNSAINKMMNLDSKQQGALVTDIANGSPAEKAGLRAGSQMVTVNGEDVVLGGDVITAVNGLRVSSLDELNSYLFMKTAPGDTLTLTVLRQGKTLTLSVKVGVLPAS